MILTLEMVAVIYIIKKKCFTSKTIKIRIMGIRLDCSLNKVIQFIWYIIISSRGTILSLVEHIPDISKSISCKAFKCCLYRSTFKVSISQKLEYVFGYLASGAVSGSIATIYTITNN